MTLCRGTKHQPDTARVRRSLYRPFCAMHLYFDKEFNDVIGLTPKLFPNATLPNVSIAVMGAGASKDFSAVVSSILPDYELISKGQCFPLYLYEKDELTESKEGEEKKLRQTEMLAQEPEGELVDGYRRRSAITDAILADFHTAYETRVTKEDIFYYVYGVLHSPEYRTRFASDLKKMLPRLPFTRETADFWRFSQAGRDLARWHLNYETVEPWPVQEFASELLSDPAKDFLVQKMTFGRKDRQVDKTTIHYNAQITLTGIPLEAYDYVVNGKPALEWIIERYQITVDKDSGIRNDPNDWAREHNQPRYILDLLKRIVRVSIETMKIVNTLPALNERK
ncbi:MAG: type ISP restriction/modification enzyme [Opitutus sp.]